MQTGEKEINLQRIRYVIYNI